MVRTDGAEHGDGLLLKTQLGRRVDARSAGQHGTGLGLDDGIALGHQRHVLVKQGILNTTTTTTTKKKNKIKEKLGKKEKARKGTVRITDLKSLKKWKNRLWFAY